MNDAPHVRWRAESNIASPPGSTGVGIHLLKSRSGPLGTSPVTSCTVGRCGRAVDPRERHRTDTDPRASGRVATVTEKPRDDPAGPPPIPVPVRAALPVRPVPSPGPRSRPPPTGIPPSGTGQARPATCPERNRTGGTHDEIRTADYATGQVLPRGSHILDCFSVETPYPHASDIVRMADLPSSTVVDMLPTLADQNLLRHDGPFCSVDLRVIRWEAAADAASEPVTAATSSLPALRDRTK
ncbi:helix-turn-helix domain-containing protein [Streptomyces sp. NPDC048385]|uniref:helix-turn-helix domain-containing protein n=1 Tax=unclassified Streptomyces TaxID=2593676 RepID=UPI00343F910B